MSGAYNLQCHSAFSTLPLTEFHFIFWLLSSPHKLLLSCSLALGQAENPLELLSFSLALLSGSPSTPHLEKLLGITWQSCLRVCVCVFLGRHTVADPMDYYTIHNSPCPWPPLSKRLKRSNFRFLNFLIWPRRKTCLSEQTAKPH